MPEYKDKGIVSSDDESVQALVVGDGSPISYFLGYDIKMMRAIIDAAEASARRGDKDVVIIKLHQVAEWIELSLATLSIDDVEN